MDRDRTIEKMKELWIEFCEKYNLDLSYRLEESYWMWENFCNEHGVNLHDLDNKE